MGIEKPMSSQFCTIETSAYSWEQKKTSLAQETARRMETTSEEANKETKLAILNSFRLKLKRSGYSNKQTYEIMTAGS